MKKGQVIVFVSGLHKSGTSILHRTIAINNEVSGFEHTGVPENEGQHLQSVFLTALTFGGPGKFAFHEEASLNEFSPLLTDSNRKKLWAEWKRYWNTEKNILLEKSPPNLIRTRFLQAMFPNAKFISIIRHPIAVSLATQKWSKTGLDELFGHWVTAHDIYLKDRKFLQNEMLISYEELVHQPEKTLMAVGNFLGIKIENLDEIKDMNSKYFSDFVFKNGSFNPDSDGLNLFAKYERKISQFGYSMQELNRYPSLELLNDKGPGK